MLKSQQWSHLGGMWDETERQDLNNVWHRLNGVCIPGALVQVLIFLSRLA